MCLGLIALLRKRAKNKSQAGANEKAQQGAMNYAYDSAGSNNNNGGYAPQQQQGPPPQAYYGGAPPPDHTGQRI